MSENSGIYYNEPARLVQACMHAYVATIHDKIFLYWKNILHISKKHKRIPVCMEISDKKKKLGTEARLEIVKRKKSDNQTYVSYHVSIISYILEAEKLQTYESILFLTLNLREAKMQTKKKNKKKHTKWIKIFRHKKFE